MPAVICLVFIFSACKKDNLDAGGTGKRLEKIVSQTGDSIFYTFFHYDLQNRLTSFSDSDNTNKGYHKETAITYNQQGSPVKKETVLYYPNKESAFLEADSLVYQDNRVVKKFFKQIRTDPYHLVNIYSYSTEQRLLADSLHYWWDNSVHYYTKLTINPNQDMVQWVNFSLAPSGIDSSDVVKASYNSHDNAYSILGAALYFIWWSNPLILSRHNVTQVTYKNGDIINYDYSYNSNGDVSKLIQSTINNNSVGFTTNFYYQ